MIYGRTGDVVKLLRLAKLEDVPKLDGRKADKQDEERLALDCLVVVESFGKERLYDVAFLRATDGSVEIGKEIDRLKERRGQ